MSSPFVQVTVVPGFTLKTGALNVKLSMLTAADGAGAARLMAETVVMISAQATSTAAWNERVFTPRVMVGIPSGRKRGVDERDAIVAAHEHRIGDAEHLAQLLGRHLERPRRRRRGRRGLRESRRPGGVKSDAAFDLLGDLMDVPVENGD